MNFLRRLVLQKKKILYDSSRLDVVELTRVPDMIQSLFPSWSGEGLISTPVLCNVFLFTVQSCSVHKWTVMMNDKEIKASK